MIISEDRKTKILQEIVRIEKEKFRPQEEDEFTVDEFMNAMGNIQIDTARRILNQRVKSRQLTKRTIVAPNGGRLCVYKAAE
jgi:hypothetical protein